MSKLNYRYIIILVINPLEPIGRYININFKIKYFHLNTLIFKLNWVYIIVHFVLFTDITLIFIRFVSAGGNKPLYLKMAEGSGAKKSWSDKR